MTTTEQYPGESVPQGASTAALQFDGFYRGESPLRDLIGDDVAPWDIAQPQPLLMELERTGQIRGDVLDAGCGTADNTFFLSDKGYRVTAFDGAPTAIARAKEKAAARGTDAEFVVADATALTGFEGRFDTVVDSALFHCLDPDQRASYVASLHRACRPHGTVHLICFSDAVGKPNPALNQISEAELRDSFATGWRITTLRPARYLTAFTLEHARRSAPAFGFETAEEYIASEFDGVDEQGRFYSPAWLLSAERV